MAHERVVGVNDDTVWGRGYVYARGLELGIRVGRAVRIPDGNADRLSRV